MRVNGEAIYRTTASPYGRPAWGRYTVRPGKLYAHIFDWPEDATIVVGDGGMKIKRAYLLADPKQTALTTEATADGCIVTLPKNAPDPIASVLVIEHN